MTKYALSAEADFRPNALALARLCQLSYADDPTTADPLLAADFPRALNLTHPTLEGFVCAGEEHLVVVIRGTDEPDDWLANLDFSQIPMYDGAIHRGFCLAANQIWSEILELVELLDNGHQQIWIAGHSLGGALAVLIAKRMAEEHRSPHAIYTYGAPRVVDRKAVAAFQTMSFHRFVNYEDLVPYLPFHFLGPGFVHLGEVNYFTRAGILKPGQRPWYAWLGHAGRAVMLALAWYTVGREKAIEMAHAGVRDHGIEQYIAKLEKTVEDFAESLALEVSEESHG